MIEIKTFAITKDSKNFYVDLATDTTIEKFTKIFFWNSDNYKDYSESNDLSSFLVKKNNKESFYIKASDLNLEFFPSDVYFIEAETEYKNVSQGVSISLLHFNNYILRNILKIKSNECGFYIDNECSTPINNIYYINSLLNCFYHFQNYDSIMILKMIKTIKKLCKKEKTNKRDLSYNESFATINDKLVKHLL